VSRWTAPLGQRTSSSLTFVSAPRPKWARRSLEDMKPTLVVTWLWRTRPLAVVSFSFAPIPSRLLFRPRVSTISQWFPLPPPFTRIRGVRLSEVTTMSRKPSSLRSAKAEPRW